MLNAQQIAWLKKCKSVASTTALNVIMVNRIITMNNYHGIVQDMNSFLLLQFENKVIDK